MGGSVEHLHRQMTELAGIDRHIVDQLASFGSVVASFQTTVLGLSTSVATLSTDIKYLREDMDSYKNTDKRIQDIERQLAQNKGSWLVVASLGTSGISLLCVVVAIATLFMRHGG